jgi:flavin-dependent dehydrogenase
LIPLADGATSVGVVTWPHYLKTRKKRSLEQFFRETIALCAPLNEKMVNARLISPVEATGNYSYSCDRTHGSNYLLLGDAYAFIDPVFSSGVMLAMQSGFVGAETVDTALRRPHRKAAALRNYDRSMRLGPKYFSWFIYRITNPTLRDMFMGPRPVFRMKEALLSVLAGDIYGSTPFRGPLRIFKGIYYLISAFNIRRTIDAWRTRRFRLRQLGKSGDSLA